MKFTNKSKQLISFFVKNKYIHYLKNTRKTNTILLKLYKDIFDAYQFLQKTKLTKNIYNLNVKKINTSYEVTKPQNFNFKSFPEIVRKHIDEMSFSEITYNFSILGRNCKVLFIVEETNIELKLNEFNT
jgi:hypothetical protein